MQALPFSTTNTALALVLHTVGVPLVTIENFYTPEILRGLGVGSVREAVNKGLPGRVTYFFEPVENLAALIAVFDASKEKIQSGANSEIDADAETAVHLAAFILAKRNIFAGLWQKRVPKYAVFDGERTETKNDDGSVTVTLPAAKIVSLNASPATRKKLGL